MLDTASSIGYFLRELPFSPVSSASSAASICTTELFNLFLNKLDGARSIFIHLEWWCVHRLGVERTLQRDSRPKASVMPTTPKRRGSKVPFLTSFMIASGQVYLPKKDGKKLVDLLERLALGHSRWNYRCLSRLLEFNWSNEIGLKRGCFWILNRSNY